MRGGDLPIPARPKTGQAIMPILLRLAARTPTDGRPITDAGGCPSAKLQQHDGEIATAVMRQTRNDTTTSSTRPGITSAPRLSEIKVPVLWINSPMIHQSTGASEAPKRLRGECRMRASCLVPASDRRAGHGTATPGRSSGRTIWRVSSQTIRSAEFSVTRHETGIGKWRMLPEYASAVTSRRTGLPLIAAHDSPRTGKLNLPHLYRPLLPPAHPDRTPKRSQAPQRAGSVIVHFSGTAVGGDTGPRPVRSAPREFSGQPARIAPCPRPDFDQ